MLYDNVEDLLQILAGFTEHKVTLEDVDKTIIFSIGKQVLRGKALTDRQLDVVVEKLNYYKNQFSFIDETQFASCLTKTRMPLREIDRSKTISIVSTDEAMGANVYESFKNDWQWIKVRFPFNKRTIMDLQDKIIFKHRKFYMHHKGTHEHYFVARENIIFDIIDLFQNKQFDIDQDLLDSYKNIKHIITNARDFLPGVYNGQLKNISENAVKSLENDIGVLDQNTIGLYKDRSILYGINHFDDLNLSNFSVLSQNIINRKKPHVFVNKQKWHLHELVNALYELQRFPLVVVVPENKALTLVTEMHNATLGIVPNTDQTVLFRFDNQKNPQFNQYVRDKKLNNSLAKNIKIVYIIDNKKIPKPLLESPIDAKCVLYFDSFMTRNTIETDLLIQYEDTVSQFAKYSHRVSERLTIEEL